MNHSIIKTDIQYGVSDSQGNNWGDVTLRWTRNSAFHGYLNPRSDYENVAHIFKEHEALLSKNGFVDFEVEMSASKIVDLGVIFTDKSTNQQIEAGIVMVQETAKGLLLSCEGPKI